MLCSAPTVFPPVMNTVNEVSVIHRVDCIYVHILMLSNVMCFLVGFFQGQFRKLAIVSKDFILA